ncbi:hypothetical protein MRB53_032621 [Persea americana]|uniref:Uncharacterized protein n=1 Tax=Persea americana TaxID=3435 RepID=A0ACC2KSF2_PERAE|nr:hypothetical protein MRB53_032621 [Persea americana]
MNLETRELKQAGLEKSAFIVLVVEMEKPKLKQAELEKLASIVLGVELKNPKRGFQWDQKLFSSTYKTKGGAIPDGASNIVSSAAILISSFLVFTLFPPLPLPLLLSFHIFK